MPSEPNVLAGLQQVVSAIDEYERLMHVALPELLHHATTHTRRFLRQVGQWKDDVGHEKLASRWGYELVERFVTTCPAHLPCRPLWYLDGMIAQHFSEPDSLGHRECLLSPLGRFFDALLSRAVVSRGALIMLFYHIYGFSPGQVAKLLGLNARESQRVYKTAERWRAEGWQRAMHTGGLTEDELVDIQSYQMRLPHKFQEEAQCLIRMAQAHYRKSEPDHFSCLPGPQWESLLRQGYGYDYRLWHLALCLDCMKYVYQYHEGKHSNAGDHLDVKVCPSLSRVVEDKRFVIRKREATCLTR